MVFVGDYFAIGLVIVLSMFYFDGKTSRHFMSSSNKFFVSCLALTALTAVIDLFSVWMIAQNNIPLWLNITVNTVYFLVNIITTSAFALYLFTKILEHAHDNHCMVNACIGLVTLFLIFLTMVIANLWNGWLFYFDDNGVYCRGPLNALGYVITMFQMVLVLICYIRNRKNASRPMRRVLVLSFPVIVMSIIIQRLFPEVMLNGLIMAMVAAVLFLAFQGQPHGVHSLTELNDRHRFFREIEQRIAAQDRFQVFLINLKNIGSINLKYGHLFGDEFLYQFAFSLERLIKNSFAFHMNGAAFALVLPYTDQSTAEQKCGILLDFLERDIVCLKQPVALDYVVVEYIGDEQGTSAAEFYERLEYSATLAYQAKNRYIRYTPDIGARMMRSRYLQERLQTIDRAHGFEVWYQPVKCLSTGKFCSLEALLRLREPDGSLISPAEFIPLAEQTGQIAPITWFVVAEVCDLLRRTPALQDVSVSVNLPMPQLLSKGFMPRLNSIVDQAGIPHRRICLEFTERAILENFEQTQEIMKQLTQDGYRFLLDDFGTGYSNFNCLLQLPFQFIKLDACLVRPTEHKEEDYTMVRTLTNLFHDMDLQVIAEGVEAQDAVSVLKTHGVDRIQGFALARPMPEDLLLDFYREINKCAPCSE